MESYELMMYINSILLGVVGVLFGAVAWYFKKDFESHRDRISMVENNIQEVLTEMRADRERERGQYIMLERMVKILAKKTNTEIGL